MSDAFWFYFFGFSGVFVGQYLYHRRMMVALAANTRITTAAATGRLDISAGSTQLEEVVRSVVANKQETKEVAAAVAEKVEVAAETVKRALNGELTNRINDAIAEHVAQLKIAHEEMKELMVTHQQVDEQRWKEVSETMSCLADKKKTI